MIRWIHVLTEFDCEIRHRSGKLFISSINFDYASCIQVGALDFHEIQFFLETGDPLGRFKNGFLRRIARRQAYLI
jgi:hypothetical protein